MGANVYSVNEPPVDNWDEYYYNVAVQVARNSRCLSRLIGAVLVKDKSIIGSGYNGPPRGIPHCDVRHKHDSRLMEAYVKGGVLLTEDDINLICPRRLLNYKSGEGLDWCIAGHAERNALINSARAGISTKGAQLYLTCGVPCTPCMVEIINAGISEVVVTSFDLYDSSSKYLLDNCDVTFRAYNF